MAKSKLGVSSFDINIKFKDKEEAYRYAKRFIEKVNYICKKKNWSATAMVCISNTEGNRSYVYHEHTGKVGRPKKVKEVFAKNNNTEVKWHLHILLVSKPYWAFAEELKKYFDKNWLGWRKKNFDVTKLYGKGTYKKKTNIKKAEYFMDQADEILFCTYNRGKDVVIPKGYSLKDLYNAYMKMMTARRYAKTYGNEKRLALEEKYYVAELYDLLLKYEPSIKDEIADSEVVEDTEKWKPAQLILELDILSRYDLAVYMIEMDKLKSSQYFDYINELDLGVAEKVILLLSTAGYTSRDLHDDEINEMIDWLNNNEILDYDDIAGILINLGLNVNYATGKIWW